MPELSEPAVVLSPMTAGREVVEDYGHLGLSLRAHPVSFLRAELARDGRVPCADANAGRNRQAIRTAGLVLVRQMPGSAKGVMFITIEDETAVANLVVWPSTFEQHRRLLLTASMIGIDGQVQREGEVVHLVVRQLHDLSDRLASVGDRDAPFPLPHGRGDEFHHGGSPDQRDAPPRQTVKPRDIYIPDLIPETIKMRARNFR